MQVNTPSLASPDYDSLGYQQEQHVYPLYAIRNVVCNRWSQKAWRLPSMHQRCCQNNANVLKRFLFQFNNVVPWNTLRHFTTKEGIISRNGTDQKGKKLSQRATRIHCRFAYKSHPQVLLHVKTFPELVECILQQMFPPHNDALFVIRVDRKQTIAMDMKKYLH